MKPTNKRRDNLQTEQPNIEHAEEGNGWPTPLTDPSSPVAYKYTVGKSGSSTKKAVHAVQHTTTPVHAPEGD